MLTALLGPGKVFAPEPLLDAMARVSRNWEYMTTCEVGPFIDYAPDLQRIADNHVRNCPCSWG